MKTKNSILVVDDEQIICESCQRILSKEDFSVDTDTNPMSGIKKALANDYDVILLDLNMSELDGMQFLTKLRKEKPGVPVIIITGYPTKETKDESRNLGVSSYVLKPFQPSEILEPVMNIIKTHVPARKKEMIDIDMLEATQNFEPAEGHFRFFKNAWMQTGKSGLARMGGQYPVMLNEAVSAIMLAEAGEHIHKGFPVARISFENDIHLLIPSPVSGKIIALNDKLAARPSLFESDNANESWIATLLPDNLEKDLETCELRKIALLTKNGSDYSSQFTKLGYITTQTGSAEEAISATSAEAEKVVVVDAKSLGEQGPQMVKAIKEKAPSTKIVVFNTTDTRMETLYREQKIFYYAVDPVSQKEISSIIYGAYCFAKDKEPIESKRTTFLPQDINRVSITNKLSRKVVLLAYDNTLQFNKGAGFLLLQKLHDNLYPVEINHTRYLNATKDPSSVQMLSKEQIKNDKIILLYAEDLNKIPGSITIKEETFANSNGEGNRMVRIAIQPETKKDGSFALDNNTARALAEVLEKEMSEQ